MAKIGKYTGQPSKLANNKLHYPDVIWENVKQNPTRYFDGEVYYQYGSWEPTKTEAVKSARRVRSWGHGARIVSSGNHYLVFVRKGR